jgi:hypothetical protein
MCVYVCNGAQIDWEDRVLRTAEQRLEMIMRPSASLGATVDIFTGVTNGYGLSY